eukprot:2654218-Rhodomonas_salina.1
MESKDAFGVGGAECGGARARGKRGRSSKDGDSVERVQGQGPEKGGGWRGCKRSASRQAQQGWFRVQGSGSRVQGLERRVQGLNGQSLRGRRMGVGGWRCGDRSKGTATSTAANRRPNNTPSTFSISSPAPPPSPPALARAPSPSPRAACCKLSSCLSTGSG